MAAPQPEAVLNIDRSIFPRFELCHYTCECYNGAGEKVFSVYRVPVNTYFDETSENSPMIDDYKLPESSNNGGSEPESPSPLPEPNTDEFLI